MEHAFGSGGILSLSTEQPAVGALAVLTIRRHRQRTAETQGGRINSPARGRARQEAPMNSGSGAGRSGVGARL